jgi:hypothetical protein
LYIRPSPGRLLAPRKRGFPQRSHRAPTRQPGARSHLRW